MASTESLRAIARKHFEQRRWPEAEAAIQRLLQADPADAWALLHMSYVQSYLGHYRRACEVALLGAAGELDESLAIDAMARLRTFNAAPQLHALVRRLGPPSRMSIPLLLRAASQLTYLNAFTPAMELLDEARRADPIYPPTLLARAHVLMFLGRLAEARSELDVCRVRAPQMAQLYWLYAQVARATPSDNRVDTIRLLLAHPGLPAGECATLGFALHKELDDLGDFAGAWSALKRACAAKRSTLRYRPDDSRCLVQALIDMALPPADAGPTEGPAPVFIVGMHRSGTTLLEQLLDGHPDVHGVGELYDFTSAMRWATDHHCQQVIDLEIVHRAPAADLADAGRRYIDGMRWRLGGGQRWFTDKLPSNFFNIGFICRALPQAKILHMVRDPMETCFSNLRELFSNANPYSYEQRELAEFFLQYRRLMGHWHKRHPGRILDVDYGRLTREPEAVVREICAFLGVAFDAEMLAIGNRTRGVATASAVQVRQGISAREIPKWAPYADRLMPLREQLRAGGVLA